MQALKAERAGLGAITLPGSAITFGQLSPPLLSDPEFVFDGDGGGTKEVCIWGGVVGPPRTPKSLAPPTLTPVDPRGPPRTPRSPSAGLDWRRLVPPRVAARMAGAVRADHGHSRL